AAHHVVHWARGGKTDLDNLILLCHRHHWMVHEGGWELAESQDGEVAAFPRHIRYVRWDDDAPEPVAA
ncbi:MAG TPA: HNH endonuclease signature motif containing protein, partial [Candidatus Sulfotelmatobacter sp.]|nr:HNH endonuclease signature motif containing protein [Candidatus Sulfotelmatobacter sp.]